jgi:hypothetical protein
MVPATAYEMGLSSQDIFFNRTVIRRLLRRLGQGMLFRLGEKNKTGFIMTHLIVKDAGFRVAISVGVYD